MKRTHALFVVFLLVNQFAQGQCKLPTAPTGLVATAISSSQIIISWNSLSGATNYEVDIGLGSCPWTSGGNRLTTTNCNTCTTVTATALSANTTYHFIVIAKNACGYGTTFNCISATTLPNCTSPAATTGLVATAVSSTQINLSWNSTNGVTGYEVDYGIGNCPWGSGGNFLTTTNCNTCTTTSATGLAPNTMYRFIVLGKNACGAATTYNCVTATTPSASQPGCGMLSAPTNFAVAPVSSSQVNLSWDAVPGAAKYEIMYATGACPWTGNGTAYIITNCNGCTTTSVTGLNPNTTYKFIVSPIDACGRGGTSFTCNSTTTLNAIPQKPTANFSSATNNIVAGASVSLFDKSSFNPTSWQWSFPGGTPSQSTSAAPSVIYSTPGTYRVTLTACNSLGCSAPYTRSGYITVRPSSSNFAPPRASNVGNNAGFLSPEPVQVVTGSYIYKHQDFKLPGVKDTLRFTRFYTSINNTIDGPLGYGWSHSYNYHIDVQRDPVSHADTLWNLYYPDGHTAPFLPIYQGGGVAFPLYRDIRDSLHKNNGGDFTLFTADNHQYHFTSEGLLDFIADMNGNLTNLSYNGSNLQSITGPGGRALLLNYSGSKIISVTDPLKRVCSYAYDRDDNLQTATDANGHSTVFRYDTSHRMISVQNARNNTVVTNYYDGQGRVQTQADADQKITRFDYDVPGSGDATITHPDNSTLIVHHDQFFRKTTVKDELGYTSSYGYDDYGNVNIFINEEQQKTTFLYDLQGNLLTLAKPSGQITQTTYNAFRTPLQITDPIGNVTTMAYDANNNLVSLSLPDQTFRYFSRYATGLIQTAKDGRNNPTTYTYSPQGDLLSSSTPTGTKYYTYDPAGRVITQTDENGHTCQLTYDNNDHVLSIMDALSNVVVFTYNEDDQLASAKDQNDGLTIFAYDKKDRISSKTDANQGVTQYGYDDRDNLSSITDPDGHIFSYTYDSKGRIATSFNASGTAHYSYDGTGVLTQRTDATNNSTKYSYFPTGRVKTITDNLNNRWAFTYDNNNNVTTITDPLNNTSGYSYDPMNRVTNILDANQVNTKITYDENGNKKTIQDPNGHWQTFSYDTSDRLITYLDGVGNTYNYNYDPAGYLINVTTPTGSITRTYDPDNRLVGVVTSSGDAYSFTYDNQENIRSMRNSTGTTNLTYDALNHLKSYTDAFNNTVGFTYNGEGKQKAVTYPGGLVVSYTYDNDNHLKTVTDWLNHTFSYAYDAVGRVNQLVYPNGVHCNYTYDAAGRLTGKKTGLTGGAVISNSQFVLDASGNRISEQRSGPIPTNLMPSSRALNYENNDGLLKDSVWTYNNDNSGNRISATKGATKASFDFTADNLLTKMIDTLGVASVYSYDALGNRVRRSVSGTLDNYVLNINNGLSQVLQITDGTSNVRSSYIYGAGLLERVDSLGNVLYYIGDAQHNIAAMMDVNAVVKDTYSFDPFGNMVSHTGKTNQPFGFLGEFGVEAENTDLYYDRARYYDAQNGRFLSRDPYPYSIADPQQMNRYVYSTNNPISRYDYTGLYGNTDFFQDFKTELTENLNMANDRAELFDKITTLINGGLFLGNYDKLDPIEGVGTIATYIALFNNQYQLNSGNVTSLYAFVNAFTILFPDAAKVFGTALGGETGGLAAELVAKGFLSIGKILGDYFVTTGLGDRFTSLLATHKIY